jgi:hypothetical protein
MTRCTTGALVGLLVVLLAEPSFADPRRATPRRPLATDTSESSVQFSVVGGVQSWSLGTLEDLGDRRSAALAAQGIPLGNEEFGWAPTYGAEMRVRLSGPWFARVRAEWSSREVSARGGGTLSKLGYGSDFVSVGYETQVRTRPVLGIVGLGREFAVWGLPATLSLGGVVAPVRVSDILADWIDAQTSGLQQEMKATGIGFGLETAFTLGYEVGSSALFIETVYRNGSAEVELDDMAWDNSFLPGKRQIEFTGFGINLGLRLAG